LSTQEIRDSIFYTPSLNMFPHRISGRCISWAVS
jgi:hypothetical protein